MTLDSTKPTDQEIVADFPTYIRENRAAINALSGDNSFGYTALSIAAGITSLTIGTELGLYGIEVVKVTGLGAATLETILGGTAGQIKIFIFQNALTKIEDGNAKNSGVFYLNHLPAGSDLEPSQDDILAVVNMLGDGGSTYGYWKELFRTISVK